MSRRRWPALAAVTATAGVLLAGCGIPSETDVRVDGPAQDAGSSETNDTPTIPPGPEQADSEEELVDYFLLAAAANPEDPLDALRKFIHPEQRDDWQPDPQVLVVRTEASVPTLPDDRVRVPVQEIGVLGAGGVIEPRSGSTQRQIEFEVVEAPEVRTDDGQVGVDVGDPQFWLVNPPNVIMLSEDALDDRRRLLLPHPIYFRASDGDALVPDLRWLPSALPERQRAQTVLEWLEDGPAPWLRGAVVDLPDDVGLAGNVVWNDDRVDVALTAAAADIEQDDLGAQLWWTLRPELGNARTLVVTIDGQQRDIPGGYAQQNPTSREAPARFAVLDGRIRQQLTADRELALPALADGANADVHSAALTDNRRTAALVRVEPDDQRRLVIARPGGPVETSLVRSGMGRPAWLASGETGLVVADGELYRFTRAGDWSAVPVPGLAGIEAVAAAPDARRLALVAGGKLYLASMVWRDGSFSVNEPRLLPTSASDLSGVGFLQENWLAIVGRDGDGSLLYEITVDGALEQELPSGELGPPPSVDSFVAYPGDPLSAAPTVPTRGEIMFEFEDLAYRYVYGREAVQIEAPDLYGVSADDEPGDPRAPFFLD